MAISLVSKMLGLGLQVDRHSSSITANVYVPPPPPSTHGEGYYPSGYPHRPPPFFGTWENQMGNPVGMGVQGKQKVQRKRIVTRKKRPIQLSSHIRSHPVNSHFVNSKLVVKPLSNFDLMDWVKKTRS